MRSRLPSNPSASFPHPARLQGVSTVSIASSISILRRLYSPEVIGSVSTSSTLHVSFSTSPARFKHTTLVDSGYASNVGSDSEEPDDQTTREEEDSAWEALRADQYERAFAIRWLTSFVARAQDWIDEDGGDKAEREALLEDASALLASCSGQSAVGTVTRIFTFSPTQPNPIRIELKDASLSSQDHTGVGLQTWGSACVLSDRMVVDPDHFGFCKEYATGRGLRVLEIGAGTGLLSLVAVNLLERIDANEEHRVFAMDYHPFVLANLAINIQANIGREGCRGVKLSQHFLDWATPTHGWPFDQPFDIILGGDVVYEAPHAVLVKRTVVEYLRKPSAGIPDAVFHLMMPARRTHQAETNTVHNIFPTRAQITADRMTPTSQNDYQLAILEEERISRSAGVGRADEIEYRLWKIGWV